MVRASDFKCPKVWGSNPHTGTYLSENLKSLNANGIYIHFFVNLKYHLFVTNAQDVELFKDGLLLKVNLGEKQKATN